MQFLWAIFETKSNKHFASVHEEKRSSMRMFCNIRFADEKTCRQCMKDENLSNVPFLKLALQQNIAWMYISWKKKAIQMHFWYASFAEKAIWKTPPMQSAEILVRYLAKTIFIKNIFFVFVIDDPRIFKFLIFIRINNLIIVMWSENCCQFE